MSDWNASLYRTFENERTRPARDLLAGVPEVEARRVVDLGCGPGNSTELLTARFPEARVIGLDSSPAMLEQARARLPAAEFVLDDIATWRPNESPQLIFANASLQWVRAHATLVPRLFRALEAGGVLAFQVPDSEDEPSHRAMARVAARAPFASACAAAAAAREPIARLEQYYDWLASTAERVDVWRTSYAHPVESPRAIVEWLRSTGLRPFIDALEPQGPDAIAAFLAAYEEEVAKAYPPRSDGKRLLLFERLFVVAQRR